MAKSRILTLCVVVTAVALVGLFTSAYPVMGRSTDDAKGGAPRYSVVMTEGHNLLVTDNGTNSVYFYTIDKDKPLGSPLKLRASIDLSKVGEPEISIKPGNLEGAK
jgi:hypothetical protein